MALSRILINRTLKILNIKNEHLLFVFFVSGWRDLNSRSSGPKPDALDQLGHTPL